MDFYNNIGKAYDCQSFPGPYYPLVISQPKDYPWDINQPGIVFLTSVEKTFYLPPSEPRIFSLRELENSLLRPHGIIKEERISAVWSWNGKEWVEREGQK